jgi:hypothetical protein
LRQTFNHTSGATVSAHTKLVFPFNFEEFGGLIKHCRDLGILHGHDQRLLVGRYLA